MIYSYLIIIFAQLSFNEEIKECHDAQNSSRDKWGGEHHRIDDDTGDKLEQGKNVHLDEIFDSELEIIISFKQEGVLHPEESVHIVCLS